MVWETKEVWTGREKEILSTNTPVLNENLGKEMQGLCVS